MMIGQADTADEVTSLQDIDTINAFMLSNGMPAARFWSFDRDTPGGGATGNGNGEPPLTYTREYLKTLNVP